MNIFAAIKWGGIAVIAAFIFYLGGISPRAALERDHADMAKVVAEALIVERSKAQIELARRDKVIYDYEHAIPDPIAIDIGHRVYKYAISQCPLSRPAPHTGGTVPAGPIPSSADRVEQALDHYIEACSRDALRLNALQAAWPQ